VDVGYGWIGDSTVGLAISSIDAEAADTTRSMSAFARRHSHLSVAKMARTTPRTSVGTEALSTALIGTVKQSTVLSAEDVERC